MPNSQRFVVGIVLVAHLALALVPGSLRWVSGSLSMLPLMWAIAGITLGQLMLLAVWVALGDGRFLFKLLGAFIAIAFIQGWTTVGHPIANSPELTTSRASYYFDSLVTFSVALSVLTATLAVLSRWIGVIRLAAISEQRSSGDRFSYSVFGVLLVMTITALVLGLTRLSISESGDGLQIAGYLLALVSFAVNCVVAIWATLGQRAVAARVWAVLGVSLLLGLCLSMSDLGGSAESLPWWLHLASSLVLVVPTLIMAATLLAFRQLGYRLVSRREFPASGGS